MQPTKILYVEDEPHLGRIVKETLESRGFQVNMIEDGGEAIAAFREMKPDIAVLDIMLPNKDGFTIAQEIRQINMRIPILFLSARTQTADVIKGFSTGGNDYLKKPFSLEELFARIQNLLQLSGSFDSEKTVPAQKKGISIGLYDYFPDLYELVYKDTRKTLSHRENELLKLLTEDFQATTQRKDILLKIWGDDSYFNSRTLDVYVRKLRDYLKEDPNVKIMTIKSVGYKVIIEE